MTLDYDKLIEKRENAAFYFREFFTPGYNLRLDPNVVNRNKLDQYFEYYKSNDFKVLPITSIRDRSEEEKIIEGYEFIGELLEERNKYELNNLNTILILDQYYNLIEEIGRYKFIPHRRKTVGDNQNKANHDMVMNLNLLEPVIKKSLKDIDNFISKDEDSEFANNLRLRIWNTVIKNEDAIFDLSSKEDDYHNVWDGACRDKRYTYRDLGDAKRTYRKQKNFTGRRVLDLARELVSIDKDIMLHEKKEYPYELTYELSRVSERIAQRPNYYSYLNKEEVERYSENNRQYKKSLNNR